MKKTRTQAATDAVNDLFKTAPANQSKATKLADTGARRAAKRTKKTTPKGEPSAGPGRREQLKKVAAAKSVSNELAYDLPLLSAPWMRIQERAFAVEDPEGEFDELESQLRLTDALTPGNLQSALNNAEDCARRAHRLYIVARVEFERFELEMTPVVEAMRDAALKDLQGEKERKERTKAITEADVKGRASILFPDEWGLVQERRLKAEGMMDQLKTFAHLWAQRCYSLGSMLNAGKRS